MPRKRLLASWIGHNDMRACSMSLPAKQRDEILAASPGPRPAEKEAGTIKTLVEHEQFDEIRLLSNYPNPKKDTDRTAKAFFVPKQEIAQNAYDLSINRYKEIVHEEVKYDPPKTILRRLKKMEAKIAKDLDELEAMLG